LVRRPLPRGRGHESGETVEEALESLKEALGLYFEDAPVPDANKPPIIATLEIAA